MNFLNEVAQHYPDAISLAAGRPYEGFFDLDAVHRHLETYRAHLVAEFGGDTQRALCTILQYGRTKGIIHELVARHLAVDEGITADPESIVVTVGCQEAVYLTLRALRVTDRDALLAVVPSYVGAHGAAQLVDMPLLPVKDTPHGVDVADLAAVVRDARTAGLRPRALYVIPDFANPSGVSMSREAREELLRVAAELDILLLEDNPYGFFGAEGEPAVPTLKSLDRDRRVVYLGSFAKTGIPGARVGYVLADQRVVLPDGGGSTLADQLAKIKSMLTVNTSPIAQAVIGGKLLENGFSLRSANTAERRVYQANLRQVLDGLARRFPAHEVPRIIWNTPTGGFFLVMSLPFEAGDDLLEVSAREHGVLWTPMHHFYGDGRPRRTIRLSFSHLRPEEIEAGLDRLAGFVRAHA
ncbi:aminotransferase-like domain-containing protein [Streptantibioticus silvisoli]|uniref:PLP-dependent aminotransferase family protein n=1 Tax=Streptantibioticus silvisoli TaxID=2705255 RepID=A0ABT6WA09_9ACTN|nr:PLP-dependent aminotransferase family protein [Streptantibioticus silvisoli]MDI5967264.1 PLP-dependent aminotransferase family protein [Streptantibioticus silvisoli]